MVQDIVYQKIGANAIIHLNRPQAEFPQYRTNPDPTKKPNHMQRWSACCTSGTYIGGTAVTTLPVESRSAELRPKPPGRTRGELLTLRGPQGRTSSEPQSNSETGRTGSWPKQLFADI